MRRLYGTSGMLLVALRDFLMSSCVRNSLLLHKTVVEAVLYAIIAYSSININKLTLKTSDIFNNISQHNPTFFFPRAENSFLVGLFQS
jgi:hypothetical protein